MIYTKEQIDKMSNNEIHVAVAKKAGLDYEVVESDNGPYVTTTVHGKLPFSPCELWQHVMPIATNYDISLLMDESRAVVFDDMLDTDSTLDDDGLIIIGLESRHENLRRAICEVFLMMGIEQ